MNGTPEENIKKLTNIKSKRGRKRKIKDKPAEISIEKLTKHEIKLRNAETKRLREIEIANEAANRALARSSTTSTDAKENFKRHHKTDIDLFQLTSRMINAEYQKYKTNIKLRSMGDGLNGKRIIDDCDIKSYSCACDLSAFLINSDDSLTNKI